MPVLTLYGTSACHLCEQAEHLLQGLAAAGVNLGYEKVDISESDVLFERYGLLIPVLAFPHGKELCWPFSAEQVEQFLGG
jgi:hypothetical protein